MKELIPTLAAYCVLSELPTYHQEQVKKAFSYIETATPNDENTICYLKLDEDHGYTLTVDFFHSDHIPETEKIYLDFTNEERPQLNKLIITGIHYSLAHIDDIYY